MIAIVGLAAAADAPEVRLERTSGDPIDGRLESLDGSEATVATDGGLVTTPLGEVRRIVRRRPAEDVPVGVELSGAGGLTLTGDALVWEGATAILSRGTARISLPLERIGRAVFLPVPEGKGAWTAAIPAAPAADLIAVSRGEGFELVECAIVGVGPDTVTVMLDGEPIAVNRGRVLGLVWLRPPATPGGVRVVIDGGMVPANDVVCRDGEVVIDGDVHVPGELVAMIDLAAGRTVSLADLRPERVASEPYFGGLVAIDGMREFFAPRVVTVGAAGAGDAPPRRSLLMRPRTVATWRVPPGSRRFRATLVRGVPASSSAAVLVKVAGDSIPLHEQRVDAAGGAALDLDVTGIRQFEITVDFAGADMGCSVRFDAAEFEK